jgi:hypothetical protein
LKSFTTTMLFGVVVSMATPASGATLVAFDRCTSVSAITVPGVDAVSTVSAAACSTFTPSMTISLNSGALDVDFNNPSRAFGFEVGAFGFNVVGSREGLTISNLPAGYQPGDIDVTGTFGTFEYFISGGVGRTEDLSFTLTRDVGFLSPFDLFELNEFGFLAAAAGPMPGYVFATDMQEIQQPSPIPEPGSMLLLATGLAAVWRSRRCT